MFNIPFYHELLKANQPQHLCPTGTGNCMGAVKTFLGGVFLGVFRLRNLHGEFMLCFSGLQQGSAGKELLYVGVRGWAAPAESPASAGQDLRIIYQVPRKCPH